MKILRSIRVLCQRQYLGLWCHQFWELALQSGGSTCKRQLIKQQVTGDAPTFKRKGEIIYALQLERRVSKK